MQRKNVTGEELRYCGDVDTHMLLNLKRSSARKGRIMLIVE